MMKINTRFGQQVSKSQQAGKSFSHQAVGRHVSHLLKSIGLTCALGVLLLRWAKMANSDFGRSTSFRLKYSKVIEGACLGDLLTERARLSPENVALEFESELLTY